MDIDGPDGDKGAHATMAVSARISVERDDIFSWNDFGPSEGRSGKSAGLFPRISPDGRHVAATINEQVYVQNYMDFRFLQTFYPTKGVIAIYDQSSGQIKKLPGADDPQFVQSNPEWSPDGKEIVFIRAMAKDSYGKGGYHDGFVTAASEHGTYGDTGGASRFYPQFTDLGGALDWLSRLVNGPS